MRTRWTVLSVVGIGTLLSAMSSSAINLALPDLGRDLGVELGSSRWVIQSYLLITGVFLLIFGRLSDAWGHRRVYLSGFAIFALASIGCALAGTFWALVGMRLVQGLGGAMVMATGPALLTTTFAATHRGRALGTLATATYLGLTAGPPLGGWLVAMGGWRWTFLINVPVAVTVLALGWRFLPAPALPPRRPLPWTSAMAYLCGMSLMLLALSEGHRWGVTSAVTLLFLGAGGVALLFFGWRERRATHPLLSLQLFRSRLFTGATLSAFANYVSLFVVILLLPFYLLEGRELPPAQAGLYLAVQPALMALVASPSGWLSDRLGSRGLATFGLGVLAVGLLGLAQLGVQSGSTWLILCLVVMGVGTGVFISPNSSALMGAAPREQQGMAGGVLAQARIMGMLLGVSLASTLFQVAGGRSGRVWQADDFAAMRLAFAVAAGVALLGAVAASLRGATVTSRST